MRILFIGPMPPPVGGATVLFKQLIDDIKSTGDEEIILINTTGGKGLINYISRILKIIFLLTTNISKADVVSFHSSISGAVKIGVVVHVFCLIFNKKWSFRGFGGNYNKWYENTGFLNRCLFNHTVLSANLVLFETKESVNYFRLKTNSRVEWYPNSRKIERQYLDSVVRTQARKFIFLGHVKETKGIKLILKMASGMPEDISIDIYGPLLDGMHVSDFDNTSVRYCGSIPSDMVNTVLKKYDVLLFPTFYDGEGYPGVILEAYACGLPVITSRWRNIPEIVDASSGILIEPKNIQELKSAVMYLYNSNEVYMNLCKGVKIKVMEFDSVIWSELFVQMHKNMLLE